MPSDSLLTTDPTLDGDPPTDPAPVDPTPGDDPPVDDDRPKWLPEKFKTAEDFAAAYKSLETKLRTRDSAPEKYELELPEGAPELEDAVFDVFRDSDLNNDQAQAVMKLFYEQVYPQVVEAQAGAERARLGQIWSANETEVADRLRIISSWAEKNMTEEQRDYFGASASGVLYLESRMLAAAEADRVPRFEGGDGSDGGPSPRGRVSAEKIQQWVQDARYDPSSSRYDPVFAKRVQDAVLASTD